MMYLIQPVWLVLIIPFGLLLYLLRMPTGILTLLRGLVITLVILAMSRPVIQITSSGGTVVVVADRSKSMPADSTERQEELIKILASAMGRKNQVAVVSYGARALVEQAPQFGTFSGFITDPGTDQSNLAEALKLAESLIPENGAGRVLVLSDGRWTGTNPDDAIVEAAGRGIAIDYRLLERAVIDDCAIQEIDAPDSVLPGESFYITALIFSPRRQTISFSFFRDNAVISSGTKTVSAGVFPLVFRDTASGPGVSRYQLEVTGEGTDPVPENNRARILVGIQGNLPLLCVKPLATSGLANLLARGGLETVEKRASDCSWTLEELAGYSGVLLENIPANDIGQLGMERLAAWVTHSGSGLMLTGGKNGYGPGGYFKSALDPILPVSMELRQEHRKFKLAIAVAMDRSGSMGMSAGSGKTKMDLANIGAVQVLDLLSEQDEFGVIAVDSAAHVIVQRDTVANNEMYRGDILRIESMGGGIFIYEALSAAAGMLAKAEAGNRHIILFADAADSEEPGKYRELLEQCAKANITVSVIGLGTRRDADAALLEDIAKIGNGQIFFTDNAEEIPRLFAQDTFSVARSAFIEERTPVKITGGFSMLSDRLPVDVPDIGGYSLCYLKPDASLGVITCDEYEAPVVASWFSGRGRIVCYTGEADGEYSGPIAGWSGVGDFFGCMARWSMGDRDRLPDNMIILQHVRNGVCRIELHLDPERHGESFSAIPVVSVVRGVAGAIPEATEQQMNWENADLLAADVLLQGSETVLASVCIPGLQPVIQNPVCLPYSPEYMPPADDRGRPVLQHLAESTGGKERSALAAIWDDLPKRSRQADLSVWLIIGALIVFLLEIVQRRTGVLSRVLSQAVRNEITERQPEDRKTAWIRLPDMRKIRRIMKYMKSGRTGKEKQSSNETKAEAGGEKTDEVEGTALGAMQQARQRAERRTKKK